MGKASLFVLKALMILICAGWVSLWLLKPTELWTRKWRKAEEKASATLFGYNGLDFAVYTFPVIALAITGFVYQKLKQRESRIRQGRSSVAVLSNPIVVSSYVGVLSSIEIICVFLFLIFLAWTFYSRISNDFKKMVPIKSFKLKMWQYKLFRMATRCGLLAEACLALLLLPILRGMSLFRVLGIQFEASVRYHIWLGTSMIFFATLHGSGTFFIWGIKHHVRDEMWKWQKTGRIYLAGEITLLTGLIIWITSLPQIRRNKFEIFYYTHHLYVVFFVFFLFHAGDRHFYMVFPAIFLFGIEKLLRIIQSKPETCILSARIFPCKAVQLTLPKDPRLKYAPTSVIFVKIPIISKFQWHCFSITSSCITDDQTMSIIIKNSGTWTNDLCNLIQADNDQKKCIPVAVEGPYGPTSMDFLRYDSLLLVAGGAGITPFLSILQEISTAKIENRNRSTFATNIQLIYASKNSQDISLLNPILPQIMNKKNQKFNLKLKFFVTQEDRSVLTIKQLFNALPQEQTLIFETKSGSYPILGSDSLVWMAAIAGLSSIVFLVFLSCFNHIFLKPAKHGPNQKNASSLIDLLLIFSFAIAIVCSSLATITWRWKRMRKDIETFSNKETKIIKTETETETVYEEHEIHFRSRPNFQEIFSKFPNETGGSNIGVLVCGPETMKESVASACRLRTGNQKKQPFFNFHSLNFTL